jgi:hypothetical protein
LKNILEKITILEQNSTNVGLSRFKMVSRVNIEWCEKLLVILLRKYDVCVKEDAISDTTTPRHKSTNPEAGIYYTNWGLKQESK